MYFKQSDFNPVVKIKMLLLKRQVSAIKKLINLQPPFSEDDRCTNITIILLKFT